MPFLLAEILNFQGSTHHIGVGSFSYSPKYAAYQKEIREKQIERAKAMLSNGRHKKNRKNPNDPARFIDKTAVTKDGEMADILYFLDEEKIAQEAQYDGLYAVCTDLFDDEPENIP